MNRTAVARFLPLLLGVVLASVTLATFWPVRQNEFINFDDPEYVTENDAVKSGLSWEGGQWAFTTGHAANWHPITWLSHMLDVSRFGLNPMGHHQTNLLLHGANAVLLLGLLWQLTGAPWRSAMVAALFALHPLHVESVAWVAERKDVLSTFFGLLCLMAYTRYVSESKVQSPKSKVWYAAALGLFALGLMSKPMLVTWPFVMLLLDLWPLHRISLESRVFSLEWGKQNRKVVLEKIPFFVVVIASCVVTFLVQQSGRAVSTAGNLPLTDRVENAIASYVKYLGKTFWPTDLAIFYPHPETRYPLSEQWPLWALLLAAAVLVGISVVILRRFRSQPYLATGWFWYLGTLVPVIGIVQVGTQAMADRYTYVPLIGIFIGLVWLGAEVVKRIRYGKYLAWSGSLAALIGCTVITRAQLPHWRDSFSVFKHAVAVTDHNAPALANLGTEYAKRGDNTEAARLYQAALQANPHFADAAYGLGLLAQKAGQLEEAAGHYQRALQIHPDHTFAQHNLAAVLWLQGKRAEAEAQFNETLLRRPDFYEANLNLGSLLLELGRPQEGQVRFETARQSKPAATAARMGLALALKMQGQLTEAADELRTILSTEPEHPEAVLNYGVVLAESGQTNEAAPYLARALQSNPRLADELVFAGQDLLAQNFMMAAEDRFAAAVQMNPTNGVAVESLALLRAQAGKLDSAAALYTRAVRLQPSGESHYYLAMIQGLQGQVAEMITNLQQAVKLKPNHFQALNELAWILATHPKDEFRDGRQAVALAERACRLSGDTEPRYWGTLDAAYAEASRFAEAIQAAEKTIALARVKEQTNLVESAAARLILYRQNKAYRQ